MHSSSVNRKIISITLSRDSVLSLIFLNKENVLFFLLLILFNTSGCYFFFLNMALFEVTMNNHRIRWIHTIGIPCWATKTSADGHGDEFPHEKVDGNISLKGDSNVVQLIYTKYINRTFASVLDDRCDALGEKALDTG